MVYLGLNVTKPVIEVSAWRTLLGWSTLLGILAKIAVGVGAHT